MHFALSEVLGDALAPSRGERSGPPQSSMQSEIVVAVVMT